MTELIAVAELTMEVVHKDIKNVHLTVHPPRGQVRITAPRRMGMDVIRLFAISKLPWIRRRQRAMQEQERETVRECIGWESHFVWGRRYLMRVVERDAPAAVELGQGELVLRVRPGAGAARRREVLARWYRYELRARVAPLLATWAKALDVRVERVFVQRMKTKWGSCNPVTGAIRLNTELAKKPVECLEYVVVHEMVHLLEPKHGDRFVALMDRFLPDWRQRRELLKSLPVGHEEWRSPGPRAG